jgi:hypothetical protein
VRRAVGWLRELGVTPLVHGAGDVLRQSVAPGGALPTSVRLDAGRAARRPATTRAVTVSAGGVSR